MILASVALPPVQAGLGSGLFQSAAQVVAVVGTLVLLLLLVALGAFAYRSLSGDGIEWPGDVDREPDGPGGEGAAGDEEVRRGDRDDEWKYY
jgi:hypothetical protein